MKQLIFFVTLLFSTVAFSQTALTDYLPNSVTYDPAVPTPDQVLGYQVGEWHVSHDQLVYYMRALASASDRMILQEHGRTYENRPTLVLIVTSPANHQNLESIRQAHVALTDPTQQADPNAAKLVHWMGYSVHGNEASGANASLLAAYYLAAAQGDKIEQMLNDMVILFDPSFNPDGLQRFSTWVNSHRSANLVTDPNAREFDEVWPGGRTNHYWFDLNRDWMPLQHPESRGRMALFHQWKPNVLTDHHEMGSNSTFFFQPGIPSRKFPLTPDANVRLTERIAEFHAAALDSIGSLYYSEESFDDYYIGKGSTYPDINGAVGILFEQASSRGHAQENQYGLITFPQAIRNHFVTSLSTLEAAYQMKADLLGHQQQFYRQSLEQSKADPVKAIVFGSATDPMRAFHLAEILRQHDITIHQVNGSISKSGKRFGEGSYIVPLGQPQYRLIKALFETRTTFQDSLFYDISTWTLPLAFHLDYSELGTKDFTSTVFGPTGNELQQPKGTVTGQSDYAYIFEPHGYYTQRAIMRLLNKNIITEISHAEHRSADKSFARGSIIIPVGIQRDKQPLIEEVIGEIAEKDGITVHAIRTGLAASGVDLGSPQTEVLKRPKVAILVGDGVSSYEAGETWHLLDQRYDMRVTLLPAEAVNSMNLARYNRIVLVSGSYGSISSRGVDNLKTWLQQGGVAIGWKTGGRWLASQQLTKVAFEKELSDTLGYRSYVDVDQARGAQVLGGSIFRARVDLGHPLTYGMESAEMPLFRNHTLMMKKSKNPYANPLVYTASPLISGYVSEEQLARIGNTPAVTVSSVGRGRVITFADNPNFRAFWYGTNKLFMNALFFGHTIKSSTTE